MIELTCLDGSATAALSDQLVAVYRAAMGAAPFHETAVETGWFAEELAGELTEAGYRCWVASDGDRVVGFAYGFPTAEVPSEGWYAVLRQAVGPDAAGRVRLFLSEHRGDARPDTLVHLRPSRRSRPSSARPSSRRPGHGRSSCATPTATGCGSAPRPAEPPRPGLSAGGSRRCRRRPGRRRRTW